MPQSKVFDGISRLAVNLTHGRGAVFGYSDDTGIAVLGKFGINWTIQDPKFSLGRIFGKSPEIVYVPSATKDHRLRRHPFLQAMPSTRRILYIPIQTGIDNRTASIIVIDPEINWPISSQLMNSLVELGDIAEAVYHTEQEQTLEARIVPPPQAFAENTCSPAVGESLGVVEKFLIDTLHRQTALRSRKDFSYSTITRWRAPIKRYQVDALKILKQHCPKTFVTAVAHDLVAAASRLIGRGNISWVTHVPCGHSAGEMCFMNEVAQQTADLIDVKFVPVFAREQRPGSSHPRQSANLKPFKLCADVPDGTALLLDDVASSGAHMENAMRALKTKCSHVSGIAWIGDK